MSETSGPKVGLMNIGEEAKPPFAVLPDLASLFLARSERLSALAAGNDLAPYLQFLALVARAQHEMLPTLPQAILPSFQRIGRALEHGMPPISRTLVEIDHVMLATVERLLESLAGAQIPPQTAAAVDALRHLTGEERKRALAHVLGEVPAQFDVAQRTLLAAGLQVHFARLAALLPADDLTPVADGACPACGSGPMTSAVVGWPKAHNTRFCTCSLCATMWNVVRVKCVLCSSTEGITFRSIEGKPDTVKAETCDKCGRYVKILYQVTDPALEPLADDVATLGLDMLLKEEGWKRGGQNAFLLGY